MRTSNASGSKGSSESATHCRRPASSYTSFARARAASASEDTVDSLSESEREVNGLVIDAVEMLEADRIRGLLDYFEDHTEYVVAVLPEESRELEETYPTVSTASFAARS
ncbi:hypothetical protein [Halostagnicola kamekurae]|uniref:hypothetical protein n=1 Tax=Halostagnicola kamekurae TaxID=619731 RepID=UPI001587AC6B|nr:hypothetical protein [Halostagnicola kamekurae]